MKIVIIGLGAAGFAAAIAARKTNRTAEIVVIDKKDFDMAHPCGIPFYIEGKVTELTHDANLGNMNIKKYSNSIVKSIDTLDNVVLFEENGEEKKEKYDSLIITTGAVPFILPIDGIDKAYVAQKYSDVMKLKDNLASFNNVVIIGAGAIGLEMAVALKEQGKDVTVIDIMNQVMPNLFDDDMASIISDYLNEKGVKLLLGKKISKIDENSVKLEDSSIDADCVVLAAGVKPNVKIIENTGISLDGGIAVNSKMMTHVDNVYAAGDCIKGTSLITNNTCSAALATTAFQQGTVAGTNAAGGDKKYEGTLGTFVSKIGDLEVAATGFSTLIAESSGFEVMTCKAKAMTKPAWYPGGKKLTLKLVVDKKTGKVIGGQAVGEEGAAARVNVISTAIKGGFFLKDLLDIELAYCPAVSDVKDVIHIAAEIGVRRL